MEKGEGHALQAACPIPGCGCAVTDALWRAIVLPARLRALAHSELLRPFGERDGRKLNSAAAVVVQGKDLSVGLTDERRAELESKRVRLAAHALEAQRAMLVSGLGSAAAAVEPAELSADERHELRADESKWRYYCCGAAGEGLCDPRAEDMKGAEQCADCRSLQSIVALHQYRPARPRRCRPGFFCGRSSCCCAQSCGAAEASASGQRTPPAFPFAALA